MRHPQSTSRVAGGRHRGQREGGEEEAEEEADAEDHGKDPAGRIGPEQELAFDVMVDLTPTEEYDDQDTKRATRTPSARSRMLGLRWRWRFPNFTGAEATDRE